MEEKSSGKSTNLASWARLDERFVGSHSCLVVRESRMANGSGWYDGDDELNDVVELVGYYFTLVFSSSSVLD